MENDFVTLKTFNALMAFKWSTLARIYLKFTAVAQAALWPIPNITTLSIASINRQQWQINNSPPAFPQQFLRIQTRMQRIDCSHTFQIFIRFRSDCLFSIAIGSCVWEIFDRKIFLLFCLLWVVVKEVGPWTSLATTKCVTLECVEVGNKWEWPGDTQENSLSLSYLSQSHIISRCSSANK